MHKKFIEWNITLNYKSLIHSVYYGRCPKEKSGSLSIIIIIFGGCKFWSWSWRNRFSSHDVWRLLACKILLCIGDNFDILILVEDELYSGTCASICGPWRKKWAHNGSKWSMVLEVVVGLVEVILLLLEGDLLQTMMDFLPNHLQNHFHHHQYHLHHHLLPIILDQWMRQQHKMDDLNKNIRCIFL